MGRTPTRRQPSSRLRWAIAAGIVGAAVAVPAGPSVAADTVTPTTTTTTSAPTTSTTTRPSPTTTTTNPTPPTIPANPNGERSALQHEQAKAAEAELAGLTEGQRALLRQLQSARDTLATRRFALVAIARDVMMARDRLEEARTTERQARARVAETTDQLQRLKDEIAHLAAAAYRSRTGSRVYGTIGTLNTTSASTLLRAQTYARHDLASIDARVVTLTAIERRLQSAQRDAEGARSSAEAIAGELDARLAAQKAAYDDAAEATTKAQTVAVRSLGSDASLIAQMADPHFGADDITSLLLFVQAGQADPTSLDGVFRLPLHDATLSSLFGLRIDPIGGSVGFHAGLDFAADARTPIFASGSGMVIVAGDCGGYGNCVVIDHGTSLATLYGHQSEILVRVGDTVTTGQVIGLVGSTGISTGPHLHFEVRKRGTPIDPVPTLSG